MDRNDYPPVKGTKYSSFDGRYRLWTISEIPFNWFPAYADGGPSQVVIDGWSKSVSYLDGFFSSPSVAAADDGKVTLHLRKIAQDGTREPHPLDGSKYDTKEDADRAAFEAGCTAYMVYLRDEGRYGIV